MSSPAVGTEDEKNVPKKEDLQEEKNNNNDDDHVQKVETTSSGRQEQEDRASSNDDVTKTDPTTTVDGDGDRGDVDSSSQPPTRTTSLPTTTPHDHAAPSPSSPTQADPGSTSGTATATGTVLVASAPEGSLSPSAAAAQHTANAHPLAAAGYPPFMHHAHPHHHLTHPPPPPPQHHPYAHYYAAYSPPPGWPVQQSPTTTTTSGGPGSSPPTDPNPTATTATDEGSYASLSTTGAKTVAEAVAVTRTGAGPDHNQDPAVSKNVTESSTTSGEATNAGNSSVASTDASRAASSVAAAGSTTATPHPYYHYFYPPPHQQHHYAGYGPPPHPQVPPPPPQHHHPHYPPGYPHHGLPPSAVHGSTATLGSVGEGPDGVPLGGVTGASAITSTLDGHLPSTATDKSTEQSKLDLENRLGATSPSQIDLFHREEVTTMGCNCKKTKCLKLYCQCFAVKIYCGTNCRCMACRNTPQNENERQDAIRSILSRNPMAFDTKFQKNDNAPDKIVQAQIGPFVQPHVGPTLAVAHKLGCKCRKSACMKKYCECYAGNVKCSANCRCVGCKNMPPEGLPSLDERLRLSAAHQGHLSMSTSPPPIDSIVAAFQGRKSSTVAGGDILSSPNLGSVDPELNAKANSISDAAQNLAFLKHGGSPQPKRSPAMTRIDRASRSEPEKTAVNALLMAAMVMTEQAELSTPPTTDTTKTDSKQSASTPDSGRASTGDKYKTPQRNLSKKFGSPKRKTPQKSSPKSQSKRTKRNANKSPGTRYDADTSMDTSMEEESDHGTDNNLPSHGLTPITARTIDFRGLSVKDSPKTSKSSKTNRRD